MKKLLMILAAVFAALVFTGCDDSKNNQSSVVTIKLGNVTPAVPDAGIPVEGGEYSVAVVSDAQWGVASSSEGCTATKNGDNLKVTVSENSGVENRTISVTIESLCGNAIAKWEQTQQPLVPVVSLGVATPEVPSEGISYLGAIYTVPVISNTDWSVTTESEGCEVVKDGDNIKITVAKNSTLLAREMVVTVATILGSATAKWEAVQEVSTGTDLEGGEPGIDW